MQDFPHHYKSTASARRDSNVELTSPGLDALESAGPAEFGGPGDRWSPETLLSAAIADCFILSFRAVARAAKLEWISIRCDVDAVLDRIEKVTQFTEFHQTVVLEVPSGSDEAKAMRLLEKAEHVCLITNSLKGIAHLDASVRVVD
ncbi:MAG: OsmC family protein [Gammaproteobacteria bacterium]|nr:OsmC family protein [Gammaproteobacteria bacterium]MDH4005082.1 OsmC family protein [Gammaproteobacteria bacterium]